MALINCPECSKQVSDQANSCIHCGYPLKNPLSPPWVTSNPNPLPNPFPDNKPSKPLKPFKPKPKQKSYGCGTFILIILVSYLLYIFGNAYSNYQERTSEYREKIKNESNTLSQNTPENKLNNEEKEKSVIRIPMSHENEDNRYFLISRLNKDGIEKIKYMRKGGESDVYAKMDINCSKNKIRKNSTEDEASLESLDLGDWLTPSPDWTDKDIVNFICN